MGTNRPASPRLPEEGLPHWGFQVLARVIFVVVLLSLVDAGMLPEPPPLFTTPPGKFVLDPIPLQPVIKTKPQLKTTKPKAQARLPNKAPAPAQLPKKEPAAVAAPVAKKELVPKAKSKPKAAPVATTVSPEPPPLKLAEPAPAQPSLAERLAAISEQQAPVRVPGLSGRTEVAEGWRNVAPGTSASSGDSIPVRNSVSAGSTSSLGGIAAGTQGSAANRGGGGDSTGGLPSSSASMQKGGFVVTTDSPGRVDLSRIEELERQIRTRMAALPKEQRPLPGGGWLRIEPGGQTAHLYLPEEQMMLEVRLADGVRGAVDVRVRLLEGGRMPYRQTALLLVAGALR